MVLIRYPQRKGLGVMRAPRPDERVNTLNPSILVKEEVARNLTMRRPRIAEPKVPPPRKADSSRSFSRLLTAPSMAYTGRVSLIRKPRGMGAMWPKTKDDGLLQQEAQYIERRCPFCAAVPRLTHRMLDPRHGKTIRLYKCPQCSELIWGD